MLESNLGGDTQTTSLLWKEVCQELNKQISATTYQIWVTPHRLIDLKPQTSGEGLIGTITSPSSFHAMKFESVLGDKVKTILNDKLATKVELSFQIKLPGTKNKTPVESVVDQQRPAAEKKKSKQPEADSLFSEEIISSTEENRINALARSFGLRPDYTFDTFAISSSNEMAHAAATAVSNKPGINYNPLFLYGGVGVGKTHLMHAIAHNILKNNPSFRIIYCTGEEFTNEIIRAIQTKKTLGFKDKYRNCQVLLIDDIQFLAGKNAVQEEFFHTFNTLIKRFSQIVLTSDRPPHEISLLEDRLRSRFEAGLVVDIQQPSFELRSAIVLIKTAAVGINLPMDLAQLIASRVDSARKIEGVIKRLQSEIELKHREINHELITEILSEEIREQKLLFRLNPNDVLKVVSDYYGIKPLTIRGKKRNKEIVQARHIAMFLFKTELSLSYIEIGKWFGSRDHTSAMHAIKKINSQMNNDEDLQRQINEIKIKLTNGR